MTANQIKRAVWKKGDTFRAIADRLGINEAVVSSVVSGAGVSWRVRDAIAEVLGVPVESLWPGERRKVGRPRKTATTI